MARIEKKYDARQQLTILTVVGEVTADDIVAGIGQYYDDSLSANILWDFLDATIESMPPEKLNAIAEAAAGRIGKNKPGKTALVGGTNFNMGLGVMYRAMANLAGIAHEYKIFRDRTDAIQWLTRSV